MDSYRFLARAGLALIILAAVAGVGMQLAEGHSAEPARTSGSVHRVYPRNRWEQVMTSEAGRGHGTGLHVLVIGASVSHGVGASTPHHDYVSDLRRMIEQRTGRSLALTVWSRPGARIAASNRWTLPRGQQIV
ncbi:MAG: hypothetical protein ACREOV_05270, partial [Candidatus Dormibacteraceae bacterium]